MFVISSTKLSPVNSLEMTKAERNFRTILSVCVLHKVCGAIPQTGTVYNKTEFTTTLAISSLQVYRVPPTFGIILAEL